MSWIFPSEHDRQEHQDDRIGRIGQPCDLMIIRQIHDKKGDRFPTGSRRVASDKTELVVSCRMGHTIDRKTPTDRIIADQTDETGDRNYPCRDCLSHDQSWPVYMIAGTVADGCHRERGAGQAAGKFQYVSMTSLPRERRRSLHGPYARPEQPRRSCGASTGANATNQAWSRNFLGMSFSGPVRKAAVCAVPVLPPIVTIERLRSGRRPFLHDAGQRLLNEA